MAKNNINKITGIFGGVKEMRGYKKVLAPLILIMALLLSRIAVYMAADTSIYPDVEEHWARRFIDRLETLGLGNQSRASGKSFSPDELLTRAEAAELVLRANMPKALIDAAAKNISASAFSDTRGHSLYACVEISRKSGIIAGYADGTFHPDETITREEFASMLTRASSALQSAGDPTLIASFPDVSEYRWSYSSIAESVRAGVIAGYPDKEFKPLNKITRAEAYTIMANYFDAVFSKNEGIKGFASIDGQAAAEAQATLIRNSDGKTLASEKLDKYGSYSFEAIEGEVILLIESGDNAASTFAYRSQNPLADEPLALEKAIYVSGSAYKASDTPLEAGILRFESEKAAFFGRTDQNGSFEVKILPNRKYNVWIVGEEIKIGEIEANESESGLFLKPDAQAPDSEDPLDDGVPAIIFETAGLTLLETGIYASEIELDSISGRIIGDFTPVSLSYEIKSGNLPLDKGSIEPGSRWSIENPQLLFGVNKITVAAIGPNGESVKGFIEIDHSSGQFVDDSRLDSTDSDFDGLPAWYEAMRGTSDLKLDSDEDGLTDFEEIMITFTDPALADTGGTGVLDGLKDPDIDGLNNMEEIKAKTDPLSFDTDKDGLSDYAELYSYLTDPLNPDTNGNGFSDGEDILRYQPGYYQAN
ncbi:MAG: S-layer homology domain-containing protein [Clostridiales bacterium]|jgi:hypothetical protein|nr:S-layer homology domain-containing protein [Clostridiales bacterium]